MTERSLRRVKEAEDLLADVWWDMRHMGEDATDEFRALDKAMDYLEKLRRMVESDEEE